MFLSEENLKLEKSQSDYGLFARLKSLCLSQSTSAQSDVHKQTSSIPADDNMSKSTLDLSQAEEILNKETKESMSKSCSNIPYSFKDESDIDISSLLDMRFGKKLAKSGEREATLETDSMQ